MVDRVGQQLANYRLIRLLGRGGFAEVYLGEHLRLNTQAAIKVLHTSFEDDDVEGFLHEAQTVARLRHPHIVRVFDFDVANHTPFLVMDYLPNGNIRRSHPKGTPLPLPTIVSYVTQVASALQYAHDKKLIHQDIKPENMLLDRDNTLVLSDFGIALMSQSSRYQSTQEVAGTAAYMAPEQFQGKPRRASDQYALGVVVYEWLTGDCPFHGSFSEIASQHLLVPPPSLHEKVPMIPLEVEQVVLTALAKDPKERFGSVQAFSTALQAAANGSTMDSRSARASRVSAAGTLPPATDSPVRAAAQASMQAVEGKMPPSSMPLTPGSLPARVRLPGGRAMVLALLVLVVVVGSSGIWAALYVTTHHPPATITATTLSRLTYDQFVMKNGIQFGFDAQHSHFNPYESQLSPTTVSTLVQAWTATIGSGIDSSPAVANGVVYVGSQDYPGDHKLYAFKADGCGQLTCSPLWTATIGVGIDTSPAVANGVVYVGADDHKLYAFRADGCGQPACSPLWTATTGGYIFYSSPAVANGVVYVGSGDRKLYAFKADGCGQPACSPLWTATTGWDINSSPAVANGVVYVGTDDKLYAFKADGCGQPACSPLWTAGQTPATGDGYYIQSSPAVANGMVYVSSRDDNLYAFKADGCGQPTCSPLWTATTGDQIFSSPAVANGVVYVGSDDDNLYAFKADGCGQPTCSPLWTATTGAAISSSPAVANGVVYVGSGDHKLYAFRVDGCGQLTCSPLWTATTGAAISYSSPAVANGMVYVSSEDDKLYAFHRG
jgi:serine/threonine protein kinase/outer membrane protein assembly factor BamB